VGVFSAGFELRKDSESFPSFSPDGNQAAAVKLTDSLLPSDSPASSPDGKTIAFVRQLSPTRDALILIPQPGGRERVLAEFDEVS
jgi:hypothetical protein